MKKNKIMLAAMAGLLTGIAGVTAPGFLSFSTAQAADSTAKAVEKHACKGLNSCKGQGGCAQEGKNACKGQNVCKGTGGCATDGSKAATS